MVFLKGGKIGYTQTLLDGVRREMFNLPRVPGLDQIQRPTGPTPGGVGGDPPWAKAHAVGDSRAAQNLLGENHSSREEVIRIRGGLNLEESGTRSFIRLALFLLGGPPRVVGLGTRFLE
ncbi:hypothetical protein O5D80_008622 [Batrachochytrium dendrobatidis]|nr:hypothetical protein O5D80_008622 [Batrachochytrium dendrobatidis]